MPEQGLSDHEVVLRVRSELKDRGITAPATLRITLPRYHSSYDMTLGGRKLDAGPRISGTGKPGDIARLADLAQILIRSSMITDETRRVMSMRGDTPPAMPVTPAWGLACHPYALAVLEARSPNGAWMRDGAYWSARSGRVFEIQASTLAIENMAASGLRNASWDETTVRFDANQTGVDWFKTKPSESRLEIRATLPDTVMEQLVGRPIGDLIEMPSGLTDRVAEALSRVTIASVDVWSKGSTQVRLAPCRWIEATPLPEDVDPACLSVALPLR